MSAESYGAVTTHFLKIDEPIYLESGVTLPSYQLAYQTYGKLNQDASNSVLVCHALSGSQHVAGWMVDANNAHSSAEERKYGWWEHYVGPNKPIDTNYFFVVAVNCIGGCNGSTGPTSINAKTGHEYGADFPIVTCKDWVFTQHKLMLHLNIKYWQIGIGGSLGGMQIMQWSIDYPLAIKNAVIIAAAPKLSAQNIAYNEIARQSIMNDTEFYDGHYLRHNTFPKKGVKVARMLGHVTYLSDDLLKRKFGRELRNDKINFSLNTEFQIESYLDHQAQKFVDSVNFDANTYLLMTRALDFFDPAKDFDNDIVKTFANVHANFLIVAFTSDWRFSPTHSLEIVKALVSNNKNVTYASISSDYGHDSFLLPNTQYENILTKWINNIKQKL